MIKSLNSTVDLTVDASLMMGMVEYGKVMVGNKAFEFYDNKKPDNYILIPWEEIDQIIASVIFGNKINRFAVVTKSNGKFIFATKNNRQTLSIVRKYIGDKKMIRSKGFFGTLKFGIASLFKKVTKN